MSFWIWNVRIYLSLTEYSSVYSCFIILERTILNLVTLTACFYLSSPLLCRMVRQFRKNSNLCPIFFVLTLSETLKFQSLSLNQFWLEFYDHSIRSLIFTFVVFNWLNFTSVYSNLLIGMIKADIRNQKIVLAERSASSGCSHFKKI